MLKEIGLSRLFFIVILKDFSHFSDENVFILLNIKALFLLFFLIQLLLLVLVVCEEVFFYVFFEVFFVGLDGFEELLDEELFFVFVWGFGRVRWGLEGHFLEIFLDVLLEMVYGLLEDV